MNKFILILFLSSLSFVSYGQQTVGLFTNDSAAFNGYTFFSPGSSTHSYLVDNCGELINQWTASNQPGLAAYLLPNGNILRTARIAGSFNGGGIGGRVEMYDWNSTLIWSYDHANAQYHQHHDVEYLPNGNILILAWESRSTTEAINSGRDPNAVNNNGVWPTRITEVQPVGLNGANVVWEWHLWDHLVQDFDNTKANYGAVSDHPELLDINAGGNSPDWIHANSIDYNPVLDQIMISSKSMSEIFVIDHSTTTAEAASHTGGTYGKGGDFLYRWGNPQNYGRGTTADRKLYGQHDASWVPAGYPDEGKISIFNNGIGRPGGSFSTSDLIISPVDMNGNYTIAANQAYGPSTIDWSYDGNGNGFYSTNQCGTNKLPNGNMLVNITAGGEIREVDASGITKWRYVIPVSGSNPVSQGTNPGQNGTFRAYRYSPSYSAFAGKTLTPMGPIELNPLPSNCTIYTGIDDASYYDETITVYSTLYSNQIHIYNSSNQSKFFVRVYNTNGQLVYSGNHSDKNSEINSGDWKTGIYIVQIFDSAFNPLTVKKLVK